MKIFQKAVKESNCLVFMDLEATSASHELIEIGAYRVIVSDEGAPLKVAPPFKRYVKAKSPIGYVVTRLTGITEEKLKREGIPFSRAMEEFRQYVGSYWKAARFLTFGPHDIIILSSSSERNKGEHASDIVSHVIHSHLDFQGFLSQYVQDRNGNPYSLHNYLKIFDIDFLGQEHDALADAYNLYRLYFESQRRKDILTSQYELTLSHFKRLPPPLKEAFKKLYEGEDLTLEKWKKAVEDTFK